ncbi:unnamed protein product, partial [Discosporangium mesarthrocarpum]
MEAQRNRANQEKLAGGVPGSKEAKVEQLRRQMEEGQRERHLAPGYEMGPLGVPVMQEVHAGNRHEQRA